VLILTKISKNSKNSVVLLCKLFPEKEYYWKNSFWLSLSSGTTYRKKKTDTLSLRLTDTTNNLTTKSSLPITLAGLPTINVPTSPTVTAGTASTISGITVGDLASTAEQLTLTVLNGTITFGTKTGLTVTRGSYGSKSVRVTGTLANLQTDLATLSYTGGVSYKGTDTLSLSLTDTTYNLTRNSSLALTVVAPPV